MTKAIVLPESQVQRISSGFQKIFLSNDERIAVDKDYFLVSRDTESTPGSIYIHKRLSMTPMLFDSIRNLHYTSHQEKEKELGKDWPVNSYMIRFRPFIEPGTVKGASNTKGHVGNLGHCGDPVASEMLVKDPTKYDARPADTNVLLNDWGVVCQWYETLKETGKFKFSRRAIEDTAMIIYRECRKRGIDIDDESASDHAKELLERSKFMADKRGLFSEYYDLDNYMSMFYSDMHQTQEPDPVGLFDVVEFASSPNMFQRFDFSLIGRLASVGSTDDDIPILVHNKEPDHLFEFGCYRSFPKNLWPRMKFIYDERDLDHEMASVTFPASEFAVWTTAYVNKLPDDSFALIIPGGKKDSEGKTTPRSLRKLPYKDADGKVNRAHVVNALSRLPQTNAPKRLIDNARRKIVKAAKSIGIKASDNGKFNIDMAMPGEGVGPGGSCVCPDCGATINKKDGVPCTTMKCPKCGKAMIRSPEDYSKEEFPYPGFHSARIIQPSKFDPDSFRTVRMENGMHIIVGKLKGESSTTAQAYRFPKDKFSEAQCKEWLNNHDIKWIKFEPASGDKNGSLNTDNSDFYRHSKSVCMEKGCKKKPELAFHWADGRAYSWFCEEHGKVFFSSHAERDKNDGWLLNIIGIRKVEDGEAADKFDDNGPKVSFSRKATELDLDFKPESEFSSYEIKPGIDDEVFCDFSFDDYIITIPGGKTFEDFSDIDSIDDKDLPDAIEVQGPLFYRGDHKGVIYDDDVIKNSKLEPWHRGMSLPYINMWHDKFNELARVGMLTKVQWKPNEAWHNVRTGEKGRGVQWAWGTVKDPDAIRKILKKKQFQFSSEVRFDRDDKTRKAKWMATLGAALLDNPHLSGAQVSKYRPMNEQGEWGNWEKLPSAM